MALNDEDKYKRPEWSLGNTAGMAAAPTYLGLKAVGGGSATQGLKNVGKAAGVATRATGSGVAQAGRGVAGFMGNSVRSAGGVTRLAGKAVAPVAVASSSLHSLNTDTDNYYERHGWLPKPDNDDSPEKALAKDLLARTVGVAGDTLSNTLTFGAFGEHFYKDRIREGNEALANQTAQAQTTPQAIGENKRIYHGYDEPVQDTQAPTQTQGVGGLIPSATPYKSNIGGFQGGLKPTSQSYNELIRQVQDSQKQLLGNQNANLGLRAFAPQRDWQNEAQRKALLEQATTPIEGARGLTANQMRLAHELSQDDIKLAQERYLQQNNLNHQLLQEQLQQQGQNARTLANEQGQNARFGANLGLDATKFAQNLHLDVAKFNQDSQNSQYELGLKGADLRSRLQSQAMDDKAKAEKMSLYNQYVNAKDDEQRDKILTQLAVLTGQGGSKGDEGRFDTMTDADGNQALYHTKTGQIMRPQAKQSLDWDNDPQIKAQIAHIAKTSGSVDEKRKALIALGVPTEQVDNVLGA